MIKVLFMLVLCQFIGSCNYNREVRDLTENFISMYNPPISEFRKEVLVDAFVRVSLQHFDNMEEIKYFALLVAIESGFNPDIGASKAGAKGLSQIMAPFAKSFANTCGYPTLDIDKDLNNIDINLKLGACVFKQLLIKYNGNAALAMGAYNAGTGSKSIAQIDKVKTITNEETSGYLSKAFSLLEKIK